MPCPSAIEGTPIQINKPLGEA